MPEPYAMTAVEMRAMLDSGDLTVADVARSCVDRVTALDRQGPGIRAVIELNPEVEQIAAALDLELRSRGPRGPLHGVPILLKDNIDTADMMLTTAGSLALEGVRRHTDATVARRLRDGGAVLLGKLNMSEWANFRSTKSSSGWSARGGQALNPFVLDRTPCGSSSGSGSAIAARYAPAALGTETSGSILCPAAMNGVVGIKPTVGLTSRAGVIPVSHTQDTVGPFARTVRDAALVLSVIAGRDPRDPATMGSGSLSLGTVGTELNGQDLRGRRIGVPRHGLFGYDEDADRLAEAALYVLRDLGAEIVDPADIPSIDELSARSPMLTILHYDFKVDLNDYLSALPEAPVRSLEELIRFNEEHAEVEMPYFGQEIFEQAQAKGPLTEPEYLDAVAAARRLSRDEGIDAVMVDQRLDALVAPTSGPAFPIDHQNGDKHSGGSAAMPAMAGYPVITVPAGMAGPLPIGLSFIGRAFSEPLLIAIAHAFEQATSAYSDPRFLPSL